MNETFTFKINKNKNTNLQSTYEFYKNEEHIGFIDYYDEYTQIVISMVYINQDNVDANIQYRRLGYGSLMIHKFIDYIKKKYDMVNKIVLIPSKFDGVNKNWLCNFYEKNGFVQERNGFPFYIKKI
jgi:uncharacterized protein YfkK (UPF0435 family)